MLVERGLHMYSALLSLMPTPRYGAHPAEKPLGEDIDISEWGSELTSQERNWGFQLPFPHAVRLSKLHVMSGYTEATQGSEVLYKRFWPLTST